MELPAAVAQLNPALSLCTGEAKCSQPSLLRLLAISCLGKAIYDPPLFDVDNPQTNHCKAMINVTRNIDHLTTERNLQKLLQHVQTEYGPTKGSLVSGLEWSEGKLLVRKNGEVSEITSSHIKGEAYEILCAIVFKCKQRTPLNIKNYYHELAEDCEDVECTVKNVFLSEKEFDINSLSWFDNATEWPGFGDRIKDYLIGKGAPPALVDKFIDDLKKNIVDDLGFDLLVELEENSSNIPDPNRHLILAQCKYRSNEFSDINMSEYIGKYYSLVHLLDQINSTIQKGGNPSSMMLCPFFWMSTQTRLDPMNYFSTLCLYGRVKFYGNLAMSDDHTVCNLIENIDMVLTNWKQHIKSEAERKFEFKFKSERQPHGYQKEAIDSVSSHFTDLSQSTSKYASVIMATGSGKTLTSFLSARKLLMGLQKTIEEENIAASLHLSPMIRLVMQNAHEWLAEELAIEKENMRMIYYCVCSLKKEKNMIALSGCTSVRLITSEKVFSVFKHHKDTNTLHRCRFFTTYQAGKVLVKTMRRINLELYKRNPTAQLFGVTVRDEAHTAVGRGSKSYSSSLYLPTYTGLSFTASPKYEVDNLHKLFPPEENSANQQATYLSLPSDRIFPQVDSETLKSYEENAEIALDGYETKQWSPIDLLSEDMLFCMEETGEQYDWSFFQKKANEGRKNIVIFYIKDAIVYRNHDNRPCYDIILDQEGNPEYFGVVGSSAHGQGSYLEIQHDSECYGVNKELNKLFVPRNERRGFSIHDMTGLGTDNRIGPVIHKLSYSRCMELNCLAKPRLLMLQRKVITHSEVVERFNIENLEYLDAIFGKIKMWNKSMQADQTVVKSPHEVPWRLTICGNIVDGTAHQFRSMKLLLDCFMLQDSQKPINTALVFCLKTEESKACKSIFDALLEKYAKGRFPEEEEFFTGVIYTSDASAEDDDDFDMSYDEQQDTIASFCRARRGVLFNVKLVGIGVDLPSIDAALIVNAGKSPSDITQKDGRALRTDPKVPDKIATVIVPSWDVSDVAIYGNDSMNANSPCTPATSEFTGEPSTFQGHPSTPQRTSTGLASVGTPINSAPPAPESWTVPVRNSFEEKFWLQVRVLKAMMDPEISMITSTIEGSLEANNPGKALQDAATSAKSLLKNIMGDSKGKPHVPVYDESLSEFLLDAWDTVQVDLDSNPRGPRQGTEDLKKLRHEQKSKIFLLVACCACCHHTHLPKNIDFEKGRSYLWASGVEPFKDRMPLDSIKDRGTQIDWSIVGLQSVEDFERAVFKAGGRNHNSSKDYKNSFDGRSENERNTIIDEFFEFLENDIQKKRPTILEFMEILCQTLPTVFPKCSCDGDTHNLAGFGLDNIQEFKERFSALLSKDWMTTVRRPGNRTQSRSTGTKRTRLFSEFSFDTGAPDEDNAITSPMSQPDQPAHNGNAAIRISTNEQNIAFAAGPSNMSPRRSSVQSRLDMDVAMSTSPPPGGERR